MLKIRVMNLNDVPLGCRLAGTAGWNQLPSDWHRLLALEPAGCFVAQWDGQPAGTTCVTRFATIAWISMVLVDPAYRGRGIGTQLMQHALAWLDQCGVRTVRLDATALGRPVYEKLGFVCEYEVARWEIGSRVGFSPPPDQGGIKPTLQLRNSPEITWATNSHLEAIAALDQQATGTPRGTLLARLFAERPEGMRVTVVEGRITGFSGVRRGGLARQIGPVVALDVSSGSGLLDAAFFDNRDQAVFIDVPLPNRPAMQWAEARGLRVQRQFLRMFRGQPVADRPEQIWATFGPEKG